MTFQELEPGDAYLFGDGLPVVHVIEKRLTKGYVMFTFLLDGKFMSWNTSLDHVMAGFTVFFRDGGSLDIPGEE